MQTIHERAFKSAAPTNTRVERRIADDAFDLQIIEVEWTEPGEASFEPDRYCFIEMLYAPVTHLFGCYRDGSRRASYRRIGKVLLVPPSATLSSRWTTGYQKTLSCMFDLSRLGLLSGFDWRWENLDLAATLDVKNPFLEALLQRLADELVQPSFASRLQIDSLLTLLACELQRQFPALIRESVLPGDKLSNRQLQQVKELIDRPGPDLSLAELALACGLRPRELSERFKNTTGVTLRTFASEARIRKAKVLLSDERYLIKQIAYLSGFRNAAAFTSAFRRQTGRTPHSFRSLYCH